MNRRLAASIPLVALLLVACGGGGSGGDGGAGGGGGDGTCQSDCLTEVLPRVRVLLPGAGSRDGVSGTVKVAPESGVFVDRDGTADLTFGQAAACQLTQVLSTKEADLLTRNPANAFFSLNAGRTHCVFSDRLAEVAPSDLCGIGEVLATGVTIGRVTCQHDPVFEVAVYRGSFVVRDPSGTETALAEGLELRFDFEEGTAVVDTAVFTPEEVAVFERLAASIDMEIPPPETETPTTDTSPVVPENIEAPTISRQDPQGPLAADPGEWSGDPEFAYQWEGTCSFEGTDCRTIEGATEPIYSPLQEDCPYVRVVVEARTDDGLVSAVSAPFNLGCVE